jgi:hypothetical protein
MAILELSCFISTGRIFQPMVKMAADDNPMKLMVTNITYGDQRFTDGDQCLTDGD